MWIYVDLDLDLDFYVDFCKASDPRAIYLYVTESLHHS